MKTYYFIGVLVTVAIYVIKLKAGHKWRLSLTSFFILLAIAASFFGQQVTLGASDWYDRNPARFFII
jgi:cell division protein FtsW (lipid II flippase)